WLRTTPRRYRPEYSNPKPLERTQNWIKLGGKVTSTIRENCITAPSGQHCIKTFAVLKPSRR
ncbi:hypothetical protein ACQZ5M_20910, partial [Rhizobium sp. 22-785-1]